MLAMGYDAHGNRTALTAKIGGQSWTTKTGYDADHRPNRITDPLERSFAIAYDADGNRTQLQYPNTTTTRYAYDANNRVTSLTTVQGTSSPPILSYAYTLDLAGRRTQLTEGDGTVRAYGYDGIDRLTTETVTGALSYAKTFAYDAVGNRLTQTTTGAGAGTVHYAYDARDRLTTENATSYTYDADGNVTAKAGEAAYTWDFENRLTSATMSSGTVVAHQYDPDGNRVQTSVTPSGGTATITNMLVDTVGCASCGGGLSQVVAETDGSGSLTALYVRAGDELLAVMRPAAGGTWTTRFVHHDGLGSVRALTDETGTTIDTRAYEAFGTKTTEAGNDPLTYGFAGEPFEGTSKLAYHRARWMDARVGRFEGMDPDDGRLLHPLSLHRYIYAAADPLDNVDPTGREYDMASIGAGLEGSLVLSTLATVSFVAAAADIVCSVAENVSGVGIDPSKCPRIEYFNHYTDLDGYNTIRFFDEIWPPNGFVYLTKTRYLTADTAQAYLALPRPPVGFYAIPSTNLTFVQYLGPALPAFGQPGGGNEWFTYPPVPIANAIWTSIN
jgi:RHS repeat-associated protein